MNLHTKIILLISTLAFMLAASILWYMESSVRSVFREQTENSLRIIAEKNELVYFIFLNNLKNRTLDISSESKLRDMTEKVTDPSLSEKEHSEAVSDLSQYLNKYTSRDGKDLIMIDLLDQNGIVAASSMQNRIGQDEYQEEKDRTNQYFSKAINANFGETFVRSIVFDEEESKEPMFHITTHIFSNELDENNNPKPLPAVLLIHFVSLSELSSLLEDNFRPFTKNALTSKGFTESFKSSETYLVNSDKILVTKTNTFTDTNKKVIVDTKPVKECFDNNREVLDEYTNFKGVPVIGASMCLRSDGLVLISEITTSEAYGAFNDLSRNTSILGILFLIGVSFISIFTIHRPLKKLTEFASAAKKVSQGDFTTKIPETTDESELGMLAIALNNMTKDLQESYGELEKKVKERTSELEKSNAINKSLIASMGEGIIATDKHQNIIAINPTAEKLLELKKEECIGKISNNIKIFNENGEIIKHKDSPTSKAISTRSPINTTLTLERADGKKIPIAIIATPIFVDNEIIGAIEVFRDITKEVEFEKTRLDLLSLASHQLRTPLSGTKWLIETLQKGVHGEIKKEQAEYIDELYKINERMIQLVQDMLTVLRIENSESPINKKQVSALSILNDTIDLLNLAAQEKQVKIKLADPTKDYNIETDPDLLKTTLQSIISNAIVYSKPNGDVLIDIIKKNSELIFSVKDSGIGIPKEEQSNLFQRFYRATNAKTFNLRGTGLGLYTSAIIAKKLNGKISFESEEGKGSTFFIHIPYSKKLA